MEHNKLLNIINEYCDFSASERRVSYYLELKYDYKTTPSSSKKEIKEANKQLKLTERHIKISYEIQRLIIMYKTLLADKSICENILFVLNDSNVNKDYKKYQKNLIDYIRKIEALINQMLKKLQKILEKDSDKVILMNKDGINTLYERITKECSIETFIKELSKEIKDTVQNECSLSEETKNIYVAKYSYGEKYVGEIEKYILGLVEELSLVLETELNLDENKINQLKYLFFQILESITIYKGLKELQKSVELKWQKIGSKDISITGECLILCNELKKLTYIYRCEFMDAAGKVSEILLKDNLKDIFESVYTIKWGQYEINQYENRLYINEKEKELIERNKQDIKNILEKYPEFNKLIYINELRDKQYKK